MASSRPPTRTRTRLTPEARREQLLDVAADVILADGLQAFTMEGLATHAGVSAPLVYNYFGSRVALLHALLAREYERFVTEAEENLRVATSFEDIVRMSVTINFDHHSPGNILPLLLSQPEIARAIASEREAHGRQNARFLVKVAAKSFSLSRQQAELVISMSSGASIAAAGLAARSGFDRDATIEQAIAYIMAGIRSLAGRTS